MAKDRDALTLHTVKMPQGLWDDALMVAKANDESLSQVLRRALKEYVRQHTTTEQGRPT